LSTWRRNR